MKTSLNHPMRYLKASLVLVLGLILLPLTANAAIFIKIGDIQGESLDADHAGWIDVLSVSEAIRSPVGGATGQSRRRGDVIFEDINFSKYLDRSSPKLREGLASGRVYPKVEIEITASCVDSGRVTYFKWELKNALLSSINLSGGNSEERPTEDVSLNFEEIKWTYTLFDNRCNSNGTVEASWKVEKGEP